MKKLVLSLIAVASISLSAAAQENVSANDSLRQRLDSLENSLNSLQAKEEKRTEDEKLEKIWKRKKYTVIGFVNQTLENKDNDDTEDGKVKYKSKFGVTLQKGKTFSLHKRPIAKMVKIGLDWTFIDLNFAKYEDGHGISINPPLEDDYDGGYGYDDDKDMLDLDLGVMQLEYGMGFGPSVQVTPFYYLGKGFEHIKAYTYFHVTPSYSLILETTDDDTNLNHGYCTFFNFGIGLSYKVISLGFEHRWGTSKYNMADIEDAVTGEADFSDKQKFSTKSSRFFVRLNF